MTDPKVKGDNAVPEATEPDAKCVTTGDGGCEGIDCMHAVRVYVPTDVRPEMLDGPEAQALRDELAESERANRHEREVLSRVAEALGLAPYGGAYRVEDVMPAMATSKARLEEARAQLVEARDWSRMTPREAWEHLRAAPKVAGPWTLGERREARGMRIVASETDRGVFVDACSWTVSNRVEADALLRDAGWLLVDDEGG